MSPAQKVIQCGICGHKMAIPPGYENAVGRCTICGGTVSASQSPPASRIDETMRSAKPKPKPGWGLQTGEIQAAVLHGLVGGLIGAVLCGLVIGLFMLLRGQTGDRVTIGSFFASADPGILGGFVICSIWAVIRRLCLGPIMGLVIGASVGLVMGTLTYILEKVFVAPPDAPMWEYSLISFLAGGLAGCIIGSKVGSPD